MHFYSLKLFIKDRWIGFPFLFVLLSHLFIWSYLFFNIRSSQDQIFLHYNTIFGVDLIGSWWKIYYLPAGGLFIWLVDTLLAWCFYAMDKFLSRLLSFWSVLTHAFLVLAIYLIANLNL